MDFLIYISAVVFLIGTMLVALVCFLGGAGFCLYCVYKNRPFLAPKNLLLNALGVLAALFCLSGVVITVASVFTSFPK